MSAALRKTPGKSTGSMPVTSPGVVLGLFMGFGKDYCLLTICGDKSIFNFADAKFVKLKL
jgi:hypothetical protein